MSKARADELTQTLAKSLVEDTFVRMILSHPYNPPTVGEKLTARLVNIKAGPHLSVIATFPTRTITKNVPIKEASRWFREQLLQFQSALVCTLLGDWQWRANPDGSVQLTPHPPSITEPPKRQHDSPKQHVLDASASDWLKGLGVLNSQGKPCAAMADKYRQIQRYLEIVSHLVIQCGWYPQAERNTSNELHAQAARPLTQERQLILADMGCGKGYLTFGLWHLLRRTWKIPARVIGVEIRPDLVKSNQLLADKIEADTLEFRQGDIASALLPQLDGLIALHACNTATDDAIRRGIETGAKLIVVAPCCHKELRPKIKDPQPLAAVMQHGIMRERMSEWVTDGLRALNLEAAGYETKVFEFISSEHTAKNLMISGIRCASPSKSPAHAAAEKLEGFFGLQHNSLGLFQSKNETDSGEVLP
jgi:SAM-dependent methyltransferase